MKKFLKNMNKTQKVVALVGLVVLLGVTVVVGRSDLFEGRFDLGRFMIVRPSALLIGPAVLYRTESDPPKIVSAVVSPVTSVVPSLVPSKVPSAVGPSIVTSSVPSTVPSAVTSAVASAVPVSAATAATVKNVYALPVLTQDLLKKLAHDDFVKNPAKYKLSNLEKKRIIDLYNSKHSK